MIVGKTKIYYLANARMPTEKAHGIQIAKMCEAFLELGIDLTLIVPWRGSRRSLKDFYDLRREIKVVRLPVLPLYGLGKFGYRLATLSFVKITIIYLWWRRIIGDKFLVHLIDMDQLSICLAVFSPFPVTLEIHDTKPDTKWFGWIFRHVHKVLTINNLIKKKIFERFDFSPEGIVVFPNGIDLELFRNKLSKTEARNRLGLSKDGKMVMYTGQFYSWKGLEIFSEVAKLLQDVQFYLVGGTKEEFEKITKISNLPENLIFIGKRPFSEIPVWLSAADAAVVLGTKRDDYSFFHTSPMKLFEYMAVRVPIVAAKTPAILDAVSDSEVFFYEPDDANSLAKKITEATSDGEAAKTKTAKALKKAQTLSWRDRAKAIL